MTEEFLEKSVLDIVSHFSLPIISLKDVQNGYLDTSPKAF